MSAHTIKISTETHMLLKAIAYFESMSIAKVVEESTVAYMDNLPDDVYAEIVRLKNAKRTTQRDSTVS